MLTCERCGAPFERKGKRGPVPRFCSRRCRSKPYAELSPERKRRSNARAYANVYLGRGKLVRLSVCEDCHAAPATEMHHDDYSRPLDVRWLCASCHAVRTDTALGRPSFRVV